MAVKPFHICLNASTDDETEGDSSFRMPPQMAQYTYPPSQTLPYWPIVSITQEQDNDISMVTNYDSHSEAPSLGVLNEVPSVVGSETIQSTPVTPVLPSPAINHLTLTSTPTRGYGAPQGHESPMPTPPATPSASCFGSELTPIMPSVQLVPILPLIYVSPAGLLTVLLRRQVAVEMTLDCAIRLVNHGFNSVAATSSSGTASCIYHTAAKLYQDHTNAEADIYWNRQVKLDTGSMHFSDGTGACYKVAGDQMYISQPDFSDLTKDMSVTLLFSSSGYGPQLLCQCQETAQAATYEFQDSGAFVVKINGIKIKQTENDDVSVTSGHRYLRVSPTTGAMTVCTNFVDMSIDRHSNVRMYRGNQSFIVRASKVTLSDSYNEAGITYSGKVFFRPARYYPSSHRHWNEYSNNQYYRYYNYQYPHYNRNKYYQGTGNRGTWRKNTGDWRQYSDQYSRPKRSSKQRAYYRNLNM